MTAKETAEELKKKFLFMLHDQVHGFVVGANIGEIAKKSALLCVDEILDANPISPLDKKQYYETESDKTDDAERFWMEVRTEIEKM